MKRQILRKIQCQFRKEVSYNNRKVSKVSTAIGGTGHDGNFFACTGECGRLTLGNGCQGVSRNMKDGMVRNIIRMSHTVTVSEKGKSFLPD